MRRIITIALSVTVLIGCSKPPVVSIQKKTHPPLAYVRILNFDKIEYTLGSSDRPLSGSMKPGEYSAFNYLASRFGPPFALKAGGLRRKLGDTIQPGQVTTYVVFPDRVVTLSDEPHAPKSRQHATVCFRTLNKSTALTLVDSSGKKSTIDTKEILVLEPGLYKVEPGAQEITLVSDMSYTILDIDPKKPLKVIYNSPNQVYGRRLN